MSRTIQEIEAEIAKTKENHKTLQTALSATHKQMQDAALRTAELNKELEKKRCELAGVKDLESQFRAAIEKHTPALNALVQEAVAKLEEAKELSRQLGVPFTTPIVILDDYENWGIKGTDVYVPSTVRDLFPGVTEANVDNNYRSVIREVVGAWGYEGWERNWVPSSVGC